MSRVCRCFCFALISLLGSALHAQNTLDRDNLWIKDTRIESPRTNIYSWSPELLNLYIKRGKEHTLSYPFVNSGVLLPYPIFEKILIEAPNKAQNSILEMGRSLGEFYEFIGLPKFQKERTKQIFALNRPAFVDESFDAGIDVVDSPGGRALVMSCASCHASSLFGHTIWGLPNKNTRLNVFFGRADRENWYLTPNVTAIAAGLNQKELAMIKRNIDNLKATAPIVPQVNGLDPSLKRAALSLAHRSSNEYATKSGFFEKAPRRMPNDRKVSDSKPGTFWTLKYKNRWFSDGAFVSGNPVVSSFLINEINRGSDLREVENWVGKNTEIILELTSSVFASQAPHWTDIFPYKPLSLASAQRGETVFNQSCAQCHGVYEKFWSDPNSPDYSAVKILKTKRVVYPNQTQVLDVGTDSGRYTGLSTLMPLNTLHMAKTHNIKIEVQRGYVPPPLDGIFARYPYLHNNSVPSLCALLSPAKSRPKTFVQGPSYDPRSDFDDECIGYPVGNKIPPSWLKIKDAQFDTRKEGLSNIGHEAMLFDESGAERFSAQNKSDLIEFLKTL